MRSTIFKACAALSLAAALLTAAACSQGGATHPGGATDGPGAGGEGMVPTTVEVMAIKGPSGIGMVKMMDSPPSAADDITFNYRLAGSRPDEVVAALSSGSVDIAALPTNLAGNLYQKTSGDIRLIALITYANLFLVEAGTAIEGMSDLVGKTIHASGQGANPQYILEYLLQEAGLAPGTDVAIEWHTEMSELAALLASGQIDIALMPEPFVSTVLAKNSQARAALDLNGLWKEATGYPPVMTAVVARTDFAEGNSTAVSLFLDGLGQSIAWVQANPADAAALCVAHDIMADASIAQAAIPRSGLVFIEGNDMKAPLISYFSILEAANPASIGGSLPDDAFFYQR